MESRIMAEKICKILSDKKASDIVTVNLEDLTVIADCFVIASGHSTTQVKALAEHVEEEMKKEEVNPIRSEGIAGAKWVAIDYGDVIAHIFLEETREFYRLDRLWANGSNIVPYEIKE